VPLLIYDSNDNPKGGSFFPVILVMSLAGFAAIQLLGALVTERVQVKQSARRSSDYLKTLKDFFKNRSMMGLTISSMSYLAFIGTTLWAMQYLFMCYFRNAKLLSLGMIIGGFPVLFALLASKPLVKKYGKKTIVMARFVPGIRSFAPFVAGIINMWYPAFFFYNVIGGMLWVTGFVLFGYLVASLPFFSARQDIFLWVILIISIGIFLMMMYNFRKNMKECVVTPDETLEELTKEIGGKAK